MEQPLYQQQQTRPCGFGKLLLLRKLQARKNHQETIPLVCLGASTSGKARRNKVPKASIADLSFCAMCGSESDTRRNKGARNACWKRTQGFNRRFLNAIQARKYFYSFFCSFIALSICLNDRIQGVERTLALECASTKTTLALT